MSKYNKFRGCKTIKKSFYVGFLLNNQYKLQKNTGYFHGIATIGNKIVGVENRDGNANVKFFLLLKSFSG